MRIALLADVHGNDVALEAVLTDIEHRGGVDAYWMLGDLVAIGHAPIETLERLTKLPNARFVCGNTDRYTCTGERPPPTVEEVRANLELLPTLVEIEGDFCWTQGAVTAAGWLEWLSALPLELRETLPDGTRALGVHAAPGTDDGRGIRVTSSEAEIQALLADSEADLICVGHTHLPFDRQVGGKRVVNPGSVSNPPGSDVRACYAVISANQQGYQVELRRVDYDQEQVIATLQRIRHPAAKFIIKHLRGEFASQ